MFSWSKKARHGVTFLNETTAIWRDSNPRKHIKYLTLSTCNNGGGDSRVLVIAALAGEVTS